MCEKETNWVKELRIVIPIALLFSTVCLVLSWWLLKHTPKNPNLPEWVEFLITFGWVTGLLISFSAITLKPLIDYFCSERTSGRIAFAHAIQFPIVLIGVGTWAILKIMGKL